MFGEKLKELRLLKGMSQEDLGKRLGVTKQTVSNWEIENVTPALDMFQNIVSYFHTTPNYMLGYDSHRMLDVEGLSDKEIAHIMNLVEDLKTLRNKDE
ncbi:MAG: helix-turn-helix transcriptional regulator [Clostridia bacterium]|nr:helix-turn-helix transcriptional regulator [Clostridia bacterium]